MKIDILTLFPEMFHGPFAASIIKRAVDKGILTIGIYNIRDYTSDKHHIVDDYPFGGGAGMVMKPEPIFQAVAEVCGAAGPGLSQGEQKSQSEQKRKVILMSPQGRVFNQEMAKSLAGESHLVIICGHYEGVDERVKERLVDEEVSLGDFVLTGGEIPAMAVTDAVARMLPGVLGEEESYKGDSFYDGWLKYPQYTRPREFAGLAAPDVLLSGDHEKIRLWRRRMSLLRTREKRPDIFAARELSVEDQKILKEIIEEETKDREEEKGGK